MHKDLPYFLRIYGIIIFTILVFGLVIYGLKLLTDIESDNTCENNFNELISYPANGVVVEKYIATNNHNHKMIIVKNYKGGWTRFMVSLDQSGLYDSLEVGYLFKKNPDDPKVRYGKNSLNKVSNIDFGCR